MTAGFTVAGHKPVRRICTLLWHNFKTPRHGEFAQLPIDVHECDGRLRVGHEHVGDAAYLDDETHRLWTMNPGLREAVKTCVYGHV